MEQLQEVTDRWVLEVMSQVEWENESQYLQDRVWRWLLSDFSVVLYLHIKPAFLEAAVDCSTNKEDSLGQENLSFSLVRYSEDHC